LADNKELDEELLDEEMEVEDAEATEVEGEASESEESEIKDKKDEKIAELTDRYKRLLAEFDNFRKRTEKEKAQMFEIGAKTVLEKMLPVVDNFERGFKTVDPEDADDAFVVGMDKIYKQFMTTFETLGVTQISTADTEFDPNLHEAVMHVDDDSVGDNVIVEEFQKGYMYKDTVLRHSMVKVAN